MALQTGWPIATDHLLDDIYRPFEFFEAVPANLLMDKECSQTNVYGIADDIADFYHNTHLHSTLGSPSSPAYESLYEKQPARAQWNS